MKTIEFVKYSGAGNTFLIAEKKIDFEREFIQKTVTRICDPVNGFSADGVLWLEKKDSEIVWYFYNSDGSSAEMCGNAARCAFLFSQQYFFKNPPEYIKFKTLSGVVQGSEGIEGVSIEMTRAKKEKGFFSKEDFLNVLLLEGFHDKEFFSYVCSNQVLSIDTGVPHLVIEIKDLSKYKSLKKTCEQIRNAKIFPRGTNVTLVQEKSVESLLAVSFERGVEDFTLACGTGAVAAGIYLAHKNKKSKIHVQMPGGNMVVKLDSNFEKDIFSFQQDWQKPILVGDAIKIGTVIIDI
ncbi:MAG: diaminopimelate epimerase [Bdellovibrionaceae bacterium]|nr:diaminopimelate epimerase [Pseudobdellovibrionaceae bacterium]NUM60447.1 diaminopimelate epimerase [Pseudobdellovibrionaceae bacterium]